MPKIDTDLGKQLTKKAVEAWDRRLVKVQQEDREAYDEFKALPTHDQEEFYLCYVAGYMQAMIDIMGPSLDWEE